MKQSPLRALQCVTLGLPSVAVAFMRIHAAGTLRVSRRRRTTDVTDAEGFGGRIHLRRFRENSMPLAPIERANERRTPAAAGSPALRRRTRTERTRADIVGAGRGTRSGAAQRHAAAHTVDSHSGTH